MGVLRFSVQFVLGILLPLLVQRWDRRRLSPDERAEYLAGLGVTETGVSNLIREAYELLGLRTYLTTGEKETRAWTIHAGDKAPQAAGVIHSDFEKSFISAEVVSYEDLLKTFWEGHDGVTLETVCHH